MGQQIIVYGAAALVFCAMAGLGTVPALLLDRLCPLPRLSRLPVLPIAGWGLAALVSAVAAIGGLDQIWLARALLALGLVMLVPFKAAARPRQIGRLIDLAALIVLMAPMGLLVAGTPAAAYDEFAHWLPNARHLVETGHFWARPEWLGLSGAPGYPNASSIITLLTCQLTGAGVEAPFKTFVVILLGGFGAVLAELVAARCVPSRRGAWAAGFPLYSLLAGGALLALLAPFVDPRISFTAYTDTPSGVVAAIAALLACRGIQAARSGADRVADGWFAWTGLLSLTLVLLRTTNLVLAASLDAACGAVVLALGIGRLRTKLRWALLLTVPSAIGALAWQVYKWAAGLPADMAAKPLAEWNWAAPAMLARSLFLDRFAANPLLGAAAVALGVLVVAGCIIVWLRPASREPADDGPSPRLMAAITAIVSLCYTAFILWAYIAVIAKKDTAIALSLWRYINPLGPLVVLAGCSMVAALVPRRTFGKGRSWAILGAAACGLLLLPVVGRGYYRLDCRFPDIAAARAAIGELRPALAALRETTPHPVRVAVVNPAAGNWMAWAAVFDLRWIMDFDPAWADEAEVGPFILPGVPWPAADALVRYRVKGEKPRDTEDWAWEQNIDALLDFRALDRAVLAHGAAIPSVVLLGRPAAKGEAWPVRATTVPSTPPACSMGIE